MPVRIVQSKQNARLKELRRAFSHPGHGESNPIGARSAGIGLEGIEGPNLIREALRSGLTVTCVFLAQGHERLLDELPLSSDIEILLVPKANLAAALPTETPQPIAALVEPRAWTWKDILVRQRDQLPLVVVLAGLQDPGNLGAILRSAEAFGVTGVVSLPGTVSAWNTKSVRASAGSVFRVPFIAAGTDECFLRLRDDDVTIWATAASRAKEATQATLSRPVAFIIGNEGNGIPPDIAAKADGALMIPCPGPVESLNAAVAASVLLYEASRQRLAQGFTPQISRKPR